MNVASVVLSAATLAYKVIRTAKLIYPAWEVLSLRSLRNKYGNLERKFGTLQALLLIIIFPDATQLVGRVEKHVLGAETDEPIMLRKSTSEDCTMLAVAVCPKMPLNQGPRFF